MVHEALSKYSVHLVFVSFLLFVLSFIIIIVIHHYFLHILIVEQRKTPIPKCFIFDLLHRCYLFYVIVNGMLRVCPERISVLVRVSDVLQRQVYNYTAKPCLK